MADWKDPGIMRYWIWGMSILLLFVVIYIFQFMKNYTHRLLKEQQLKSEQELKNQQELLNHTLRTQERERRRIGAELHDNLLAQLNIIRMLNENEADRSELDRHLTKSMQAAREISHDLVPPMLEELKFQYLLENYTDNLSISTITQVSSSSHESNELQTEVKIHLFRIVQEVLNNCWKHAEASLIQVHLRQTQSSVSISITDNGKGLPEDKSKGIGWKNIQTRAQFLGAEFKFKTSVSKGTTFLLYLNTTTNTYEKT